MIPDINKTVIVTGASQGIGAGLVKAFLDRRYNVVATSRSITKTGGFKASDKLELVDGSITSILQRPRELPPPALIQRDGQFIHPIAGEAPHKPWIECYRWARSKEPNRGTTEIASCFVEKIDAGGYHVSLCNEGDAHGRHFRRAREWAIEKAFASYG